MASESLTAGDACQRLKARLVGDAAFPIEGVASPETATAHTACFIESEKYLPSFEESPCECWVIAPAIYEKLKENSRKKKTFILSEKPYLSFIQLVNHFFPPAMAKPKRHPSAVIDPLANVDPSCQIDAFVIVEAKAQVGANVILHGGVWIGGGAVIGDDSVLYAGSKIYPGSVVGRRNIIHSGAVIGSDGFGFVPGAAGLVKVPQVGKAILHDDVEVGANSTIDRGTLGDTIIGRGTKIDNLVQVGHNCVVGMNCVLCAFVGLSGNTTLGNNVLMAGKAATKGHLKIGDNVQIGGDTGITKDVPSNQQLKGYPALPLNEYLKLQVLISKLPEVYKRLVTLEKSAAEKTDRRNL